MGRILQAQPLRKVGALGVLQPGPAGCRQEHAHAARRGGRVVGAEHSVGRRLTACAVSKKGPRRGALSSQGRTSPHCLVRPCRHIERLQRGLSFEEFQELLGDMDTLMRSLPPTAQVGQPHGRCRQPGGLRRASLAGPGVTAGASWSVEPRRQAAAGLR